jgi:hypothetical protein
MSPCHCSDPYLLLELLYGPEQGQAAARHLQLLLADFAAHAPASALDESSIVLAPNAHSHPGLMALKDVDLRHTAPGQTRPDFQDANALLSTVETLLEEIHQGGRLLRVKGIGRLWGDTLHQPQDLLILSFLRAAVQAAAPDVLLAAEVQPPLDTRPAYFGNGMNAAHWIETGELPALLLDALARGESGALQTWVNTLRLPVPDITFLHELKWPHDEAWQMAAGLLDKDRLENLQNTLASHGTQQSNFLDALDTAGQPLSRDLAQRRALAAHAVLLSLTGVPVLETNPAALPGLDDLIRARAASPTFSPWGAQMGLPCGDACLGLMRIAPSGPMALCLTNLSAAPQTAALDAATLGFSGAWRDLLSGDVMELNGENGRKLDGYQSRWWVNTSS